MALSLVGWWWLDDARGHHTVGSSPYESPPVTAFRLRIAGHGIELLFPDDSLATSIQERYGGFTTSDTPDTRIEVRFPRHLQPVADAGVPWALCAADTIRFGRNDLHAETDASFHEVHVEMRSLVYTLDALLRIFCSIFLIRRGGVLLHAAAVGTDGRGVAFAGPTESGKSELSHMQYGTHLTDELSPVRPDTNGFTVYGSPFWGLFERGGHNVGLPLCALFLLARGQTRIEPVGRIQAVQGTMRCVLNFSREPAVVDQVMSTVSRLITAVPCARLVSPPDMALWPLVADFASQRSRLTTG